MTDMTRLPVACTLSEPEVAERRAGLFADLARRRQEARGQLTVEPGGSPIWLELTGPPGTREFLAHEIGDPGIV